MKQTNDYFRAWLSGFTDGEGCFRLETFRDKRRNLLTRRASFGINLRQDDLQILRYIRRFLKCGGVYPHPSLRPHGHPLAHFIVTKKSDLLNIIIPHFDAHPLETKKRRDYLIWKKGVQLLMRKSTYRRTEHDNQKFDLLAQKLKETRKYSVDQNKRRV